MHETMLDVGGVGLAAPQVGVSVRLFTWAVEGGDDWTLHAHPPAPVVQYEHTVAVTEDGAEILTLPR